MHNAATNSRKCQECEMAIKGRSDKKFCSEDCRSSFHYKKNRDANRTILHVNKTLKRNRRILVKHLPNGEKPITRDVLLVDGFRFNYFTHLDFANQNRYYKCCYDLGYMEMADGTIRIRKVGMQ